jgi:cytochrome c
MSRVLIASACAVSVAILAALAGPVYAADPVARGNILFLRCTSCHDVSSTQSAKIGPNLYSVIGRPVASLAGYPYSSALKSQTFVWDASTLDRWLTNPNAVVPGTIMAFAGLPDAADRAAIIAYLQRKGPASQ